MIRYDPKKLINKIAPEAKISKMVRGNLTLKKVALNLTDSVKFIDRSKVTEVALNVVESYQARRAKAVADAGLSRAAGRELAADLVDDPKLLINRVQNELVTQIATRIKTEYKGDRYIWTPSDADEPDPEHQLNYGKEFTIGEGEMPGDRYGCRCGMDILVKETELDL